MPVATRNCLHRLRDRELKCGAKEPAAEDDVEDGQLAVPVVEDEEGADREDRGVGVDDALCPGCAR